MRIELGYLDDDGRVTYCETVAHAPAVRGILPNGSPHIPIYNIVLTYNCEPAKTQNYKEVCVRVCLLNDRISRNWMSAVWQSSILVMKMNAIYSAKHKALWGV